MELDGEKISKVNNISNYIKLEGMGKAFSNNSPCVLLIDEIDKADIEFPNDLLRELDRMEFEILETGQKIKAKIRPLVVITSNSEKELPDAFLRRCVFHYIQFPDEELMTQIVKSHYPEIEKNILKNSLRIFYKLRNKQDIRKKPSTSELIDWLNILIHQGLSLEKIDKVPFMGTLMKTEEDFIKNSCIERQKVFLNFFYNLRDQRIPVGPREYLDFLKVIDYSLCNKDLFSSERFYNLARACLIKDVSHYDGFDLAFLNVFQVQLAWIQIFVNN